jgi:5-methylcytosine-specific restriction endonuclease McrA
MERKHKRCLILNADYSLLTIIDWQKAIILSMRNQENSKKGIEILDFYKDDYIAVRYLKVFNHQVKFSRKNLFIRDGFTCQYCGCRKDMAELTYDHVIPKSSWSNDRGSPTSWTNIVTACIPCNRKKGNKTPAQANMPIKNLPIIPKRNEKYLPVAAYLSNIKHSIPEEWIYYIPGSYQ